MHICEYFKKNPKKKREKRNEWSERECDSCFGEKQINWGKKQEYEAAWWLLEKEKRLFYPKDTMILFLYSISYYYIINP